MHSLIKKEKKHDMMSLLQICGTICLMIYSDLWITIGTNREMIAQKKSRIWTCFPKKFVRTHLVSIKFIKFLILYCKHDLHDQLLSKADRITYIKWYDLAENWIHTFISYLYNSWRRFRLFTHLTPVLCCIYCCDGRAVGMSKNSGGEVSSKCDGYNLFPLVWIGPK